MKDKFEDIAKQALEIPPHGKYLYRDGFEWRDVIQVAEAAFEAGKRDSLEKEILVYVREANSPQFQDDIVKAFLSHDSSVVREIVRSLVNRGELLILDWSTFKVD